jgi:transposase
MDRTGQLIDRTAYHGGVIETFHVRSKQRSFLFIMVFSNYIKQRILHYYSKGHKAPTIAKLLQEEQLKTSRVGVAKFLKHFEDTGATARRPGSGQPSKVVVEIKRVVEEQMQKDDETTAHQLHQLLVSKGYGISLKTVLRCRTSLGWSFHGSACCQML